MIDNWGACFGDQTFHIFCISWIDFRDAFINSFKALQCKCTDIKMHTLKKHWHPVQVPKYITEREHLNIKLAANLMVL